MKIYAPVKDATGTWASVRFVNGVGETDNPILIHWFKTHGYTTEKCDDSHESVVEKCDVIEDSEYVNLNKLADEDPDFNAMTPNELRDWAKANGLGTVIKNTRNKEKLIELINEHRG